MRTSSGRSPTRSAAVTLTVAALAVAAVVAAVDTARTAQAAPGGRTAVTFAEDDGADCEVTVPGSPPSSSLLPDPFRKLDGARVSTRDEWRCRRAEIKELAEQFVYGEKPAPPDSVSGTVTSSGITVNVSDNGGSTSFSADVQLPNGSGPFPAVIVLGGFGADTAAILGAGAAVVSYDPFTVGSEGTPRDDKQGAFYSIYGSSSSTGLLLAWAWGVSRIIDVIEQSGGDVLTADATGVTGCSRFGKGAFVTGAFDQRIALTMPIESGTGGVPAFRAVAAEGGAQPLSSAFGEQPWLGDAFGSFTGDPAGLPVDTHEVAAMVAPRGLFIMENPHIDWLGARPGSVGALAGAEVYRALGAEDSITYWSDVQDGSHCAPRPEWQEPLQRNIRRFLLGTGDSTGGMQIADSAAGDLSQWRDWQTPTLSEGGPTTPPATPPTTPPTAEPPTGGCTATYDVVGQWSGGFQAEVTVQAGAAPLTGWTVEWTFPNGQEITQLWNGTVGDAGPAASVGNAAFNGDLPAAGSTTFGFLGSGDGASPTELTCTAS